MAGSSRDNTPSRRGFTAAATGAAANAAGVRLSPANCCKADEPEEADAVDLLAAAGDGAKKSSSKDPVPVCGASLDAMGAGAEGENVIPVSRRLHAELINECNKNGKKTYV